MRFTHREHPGRCVRLAYCMNLHAAEDLEGILEGIRSVTLPLRDKLSPPGEWFGVGMYLPFTVADQLQRSPDLLKLRRFVKQERLDPFTFNAFPYGGFQTDGLKRKVFHPNWLHPLRLAYTRHVARIAAFLHAGVARRVSISTHCGGFGNEVEDALLVEKLRAAADALAHLKPDLGNSVVLGLEAEPRSNCNDTAAAGALLRRVGDTHGNLGLCLDACHSAVEFEEPRAALAAALSAGPLAKLQYTSALRLEAPAKNPAGWRALLDMDEPRYLHQVTARAGKDLRRFNDLDELRRVDPEGLDELRCHFHVPVDREELGSGLRTTRGHAEALLDLLLDAPASWGSEELHVEIETYTWDVLPGSARGPGSLVEGLEREYRHVIGRLEARGWARAG